MWAAALISAAFTVDTVRQAMGPAFAVIPANGRLARTVRWVVSLHDTRLTWEETLTTVAEETAGVGSIHTIPDAAVLTAELLYGDGDFTRSITLTVRGCLDTDSNGAKAGSVAEVLNGAETIPAQRKEPLEDRVRSAVFGFDGSRISELAERTVRWWGRRGLAEGVRRGGWEPGKPTRAEGAAGGAVTYSPGPQPPFAVTTTG